MSIITLCTDFGTVDGYAASMKGVILGINPSANIVDITHEIPRQGISFAAFVLNGYYRYFPKGTIHIVVVDPGVGGQRYDMVVKTEDYVFVGPDNGVFSYIFMKQSVLCYKINIEAVVSNTFHGRDVFAPAAAKLSLKWDRAILGRQIKRPVMINIPESVVDINSVTGEIIHIDRFGNLITNISSDMISDKKILTVEVKKIKINNMKKAYEQNKESMPGALINSFGMLEIAVSSDSACDKLGAHIGDKVRVLWR